MKGSLFTFSIFSSQKAPIEFEGHSHFISWATSSPLQVSLPPLIQAPALFKLYLLQSPPKETNIKTVKFPTRLKSLLSTVR